jgi:hypothetical protein
MSLFISLCTNVPTFRESGNKSEININAIAKPLIEKSLFILKPNVPNHRRAVPKKNKKQALIRASGACYR